MFVQAHPRAERQRRKARHEKFGREMLKSLKSYKTFRKVRIYSCTWHIKSRYREIHSGRVNVKSMTKIQKGIQNCSKDKCPWKLSEMFLQELFMWREMTRFADYRKEVNLLIFSFASDPSSSPRIATPVKIFSRFEKSKKHCWPAWRLSSGLPVVWLTLELEPGLKRILTGTLRTNSSNNQDLVLVGPVSIVGAPLLPLVLVLLLLLKLLTHWLKAGLTNKWTA